MPLFLATRVYRSPYSIFFGGLACCGDGSPECDEYMAYWYTQWRKSLRNGHQLKILATLCDVIGALVGDRKQLLHLAGARPSSSTDLLAFLLIVHRRVAKKKKNWYSTYESVTQKTLKLARSVEFLMPDEHEQIEDNEVEGARRRQSRST